MEGSLRLHDRLYGLLRVVAFRHPARHLCAGAEADAEQPD
jgi:hypothetical protein